MNASARGRRIVAMLVLAPFVGFFVVAAIWVQSRLAPLPSGELSSLHFPEPIELTVGGQPVRVSRFVLNIDRRTLTLERDELAFNDYGDATRTGGEKPIALPVSMEREWIFDRFEIVPPRRFDQRLRLVAHKGNPNNFRLIIVSGTRLSRIIDLRPPEVIPDEFGDWPQADTFQFKSMSYGPQRHDYSGLGVSGSLAKGGQISYDPNYYHFTPEGDVTGSTLLGFESPKVRFQPLAPDPSGRGRRAFELIVKPPELAGAGDERAPILDGQHILVLGPTELSEHRMIVRKEGRPVQIMRLINRERDHFRSSLRSRLNRLPDHDRTMFRELGAHRSFGVYFSADPREDPNGHITALYGLGGDLAKVDAILAQLPHLTELGFRDAKVPASGLASLERLRKLRSVSFQSCSISDEGLRSIGLAFGLKNLSVSESEGFTSAGLGHLGKLEELNGLIIRREGNPKDGPPLAEGLKHLVKLKSLSSLNLTGQHVTDEGLASIGKLPALATLELSGALLTDAGLNHLVGMKHLTRLILHGPTGITPKGFAEFRAKMPLTLFP